MGGLAAIARAAGHHVTGCDANVYPPMSDAARTRSASRSPRAWTPRSSTASRRDADVFVVGNVVSRGNPLMEAILDAGRPYISGPQWLYENVLAGKWVLAVAGTHGKTTTASMLAWILERAGLDPGFLIGGVPVELRRLGATHRQRVLRHRGRRVRHRVLRQALEVRPLPAAHGDPQQPRVRSRRHLSRSRRDRDAVPPPRAHGAADRDGSIVNGGRGEPRARARARLLVARSSVFRVRRSRRPMASRRRRGGSHADGTVTHGGAPQGVAALAGGRPATRPSQSAERARGARRRAPRRRAGRRRPRGAPASSAGSSVASKRAGPCAASPSTTTSRIIRRRSRRPSTVFDAARAKRAHHRGARAALEHDEARRDEATPCPGASPARTACSAMRRTSAWDVADALAPLGAKADVHDDLDALVAAVAAEARPADQVLVMSNGGFGGIHDKLLQRLANGQ